MSERRGTRGAALGGLKRLADWARMFVEIVDSVESDEGEPAAPKERKMTVTAFADDKRQGETQFPATEDPDDMEWATKSIALWPQADRLEVTGRLGYSLEEFMVLRSGRVVKVS